MQFVVGTHYPKIRPCMQFVVVEQKLNIAYFINSLVYMESTDIGTSAHAQLLL